MNCKSFLSFLPRPKAAFGLFSDKFVLRINSPKYFKIHEVRNPLSSYLVCANYHSIFNRNEMNSYLSPTKLLPFAKLPVCHFHLRHSVYKKNIENVEGKSKEDSKVEGKSPTESDIGIDKNLSLLKRLKIMYTKYWYVAIPVHGVTSVFWFGGFFYAAKCGVDVTPYLEKLGISMNYLRDYDLGYYGIAYAMYKIASPARYTVTLGCTTFAINYLRNKGYIKPVPSKEELKVMYEDKKEELLEKGEEMREKYQEKKDEMKEIYHEKVDELYTKTEDMRAKYQERRRRLFGRHGLRAGNGKGNNKKNGINSIGNKKNGINSIGNKKNGINGKR